MAKDAPERLAETYDVTNGHHLLGSRFLSEPLHLRAPSRATAAFEPSLATIPFIRTYRRRIAAAHRVDPATAVVGHQETKTDVSMRGRRRSPLDPRAVVIGSGDIYAWASPIHGVAGQIDLALPQRALS